MKKILIITFCLLAINNLKAQKKDTKIVLTPFTEKTMIRNGLEKGTLNTPLFSEYNYKKGISKYITAYIDGENIYEYKVPNGFTVISEHTYTLFCIINGQEIKLKSKWYDEPPDILNFEDQIYKIKIILGIPEDRSQYNMTITRKSDLKSQMFKLFYWDYNLECRKNYFKGFKLI